MPKNSSPKHLRFAVLAADIALFTIHNKELLVRIMKVNHIPHFVDRPGLPGGLMLPTETAEQAVVRLVKDRAGMISTKKIHIEQLYTFSRINRDPRGRVVAVAYIGLVPWESLTETEKINTRELSWKHVDQLSNLAYDHDEVLKVALRRLQSRITYTTLMCKLMPKEFTLTELEQAYESILKADLDKRNFRKKILKLKILERLHHKRIGNRSRPASLYEFKSNKISEIEVL
ncbi:MAG: NUDIX domain-containing protein [Minisyncoccia bacterium]